MILTQEHQAQLGINSKHCVSLREGCFGFVVEIHHEMPQLHETPRLQGAISEEQRREAGTAGAGSLGSGGWGARPPGAIPAYRACCAGPGALTELWLNPWVLGVMGFCTG